MTVTGPYRFVKFFEEDNVEFKAKVEAAGLSLTRVLNNDGSAPISGKDENGDWVTIAFVRPIAPRKRNTPYDAPDPERDAMAEKIVAALNAYEAA
jgi:hypothetical protein